MDRQKWMLWAGRVSPRAWRFGLVALVVVVFDQVTKYMALGRLTRAFAMPGDGGSADFAERLHRFLWLKHPPRAGALTVFEDFWHFRYAENPGAAWSFLATADASFRQPFFLLVSLCAMVFILVYFWKSGTEHLLLHAALALVFGGAVGNFLDRVRLGYVIDFIDWHWYNQFTWPTFNIADSAISVGVVLLFAEMLIHRPGLPEQTK